MTPWTTQNTQGVMLIEIESATRAYKTILNLAAKTEVTKHRTDEPLKPPENEVSKEHPFKTWGGRTTQAQQHNRHGDKDGGWVLLSDNKENEARDLSWNWQEDD